MLFVGSRIASKLTQSGKQPERYEAKRKVAMVEKLFGECNNVDAKRKVVMVEKLFGKCSSVHESKWYINFYDLVVFMSTHQHSDVPSVYKENPSLGHWVKKIRKQYRLSLEGDPRVQRKLTRKKIWMLNVINFAWDPQEKDFQFHFEKLLQYKKVHGNVHISEESDTANDTNFHCLTQWVKSIRSNYKSFCKKETQTKSLTFERIRKLENIGFQWSVGDARWMKRYEDLVAYKNTFGTTRVPRTFDYQLFGFVNSQRRDYRRRLQTINGEKSFGITDTRIELLKKIEFDFKSPEIKPDTEASFKMNTKKCQLACEDDFACTDLGVFFAA